MPRVRRRRVIDCHCQPIDPDRLAAMWLHTEAAGAIAHRQPVEAGRYADPSHERSRTR